MKNTVGTRLRNEWDQISCACWNCPGASRASKGIDNMVVHRDVPGGPLMTTCVIPEQLNGINQVPSMQWSIILQCKAMSPLWQSKRVLPALQKDVRYQRFQISYEFGPDRFANHRLWRNDSAFALSWNSPRHHCFCVSG
jgi:hypothetical protein